VVGQGIEDIIRKAGRRRPHLAEDLAQEARISAWMASKTCTDNHYVRRAARNGIVDAIRREEKLRSSKPQMCELTWELPVEPEPQVFPSSELALVRDVALLSIQGVRERDGLTYYELNKRLAAARKRLETEL